jgi:hypothetical protein
LLKEESTILARVKLEQHHDDVLLKEESTILARVKLEQHHDDVLLTHHDDALLTNPCINLKIMFKFTQVIII